MSKLDSLRSAGLAVTGAWVGISRDRLYSKLGWESSGSRRSRRHILFYKFLNKLTLVQFIAPSGYSIRNPPVVMHIASRTESLKSRFYPNSLFE